MSLWPLTRVVYRLGNVPVFGWAVRLIFNSRLNQLVMIPVDEALGTNGSKGSTVLPYSILSRLVKDASYRFQFKECMCRRNEGCQEHPIDVGCLFLGEGALQINPSLGRLVDVDEAQAHIQRAMQMGLVPLIAHTVFDAYLLGIPYRRMLTICFCCDCCCTVRKGMRLAPTSLWDIVHPLPGLIVQVNEGCVGCGSCQVVCPIGAISIHEGRACIAEWCKGCGRCALECAVGAIELKLADDAEALSRLLQHIQGQTEIGGNGHRSRFN